MITKGVYFISGIDTNIGKSYAVGYIAKLLTDSGIGTITQKFIQTGNTTISEDIELHRKIMGINLLDVDLDNTTQPEIFTYPCSPHLAAKIDNRAIDFNKIKQATNRLKAEYDVVLVEGAGGIMVPLCNDYLTIDYIAESNYPLIFVTSGKLGSINHTLLSLKAAKLHGVEVAAVAYNQYPKGEDEIIYNDTKLYIKDYLTKNHPDCQFIDIPFIEV